jgi:hypothetical protein
MAITKPGTASWPNLIAQWRLSGLTQAEFCARRGISLPAFRYHVSKPSRPTGSHQSHAGTNSAATPLFLPIVCAADPQPRPIPAANSPIEVVLADGLRVAVAPGFDPQTLQRVVDALRGTPC